jgi:hypothetical protein
MLNVALQSDACPPVDGSCDRHNTATIGGSMMNSDERIAKIEQAQSCDQLHAAMAGYYDEAIRDHANLQFCAGLKACLEKGRENYTHALEDVKQWAPYDGDDYHEVKHVLDAASQCQVSLECGGSDGHLTFQSRSVKNNFT